MHKRGGRGHMMAHGPKPIHVKRALGVGVGRKGMPAKHTVKHPGGFGYGRGRKR
jgi:hypothetical protein